MWFCLYWTRCDQSGHERSRLASSKADWSNFEGNRHKHWGKIKTNQEPGRTINSRNRSTSQLKRKLSKFVKKWKGLYNGQNLSRLWLALCRFGRKTDQFRDWWKVLVAYINTFFGRANRQSHAYQMVKKGRLIHGLIENVDSFK